MVTQRLVKTCHVLIITLAASLILVAPQVQACTNDLKDATPITNPKTPINAENVLHLVHVGTLGSGAALRIVPFPGAARVGVLSSRTFWLYDLIQSDHARRLFPGLDPGRELSVSVSPDGKYFTTLGFLDKPDQPSHRLVYNTQSGQVVSDIPTPNSPDMSDVPDAAFSPDDKWLAVAAGTKLYIMDLTSLTLGDALPLTQQAWDLTFSRDSAELLVGEANSVQLLDVAKRQFLPQRAMEVVDKGKIVFDGQTLAVITQPFMAFPRIWRRYYGTISLNQIMDISPDRTLAVVISSHANNALLVWDVLNAQAKTILPVGDTQTIYSVAFSQDSKLIVTSSGTGTLRLWDSQSGHLLATYQDSLSIPFSHVGFDGLGQRLIASNNRGELWAWPINRDASNRVNGLGDGLLLASDFATSKPGYETGFNDLAFSPDGSLLAGTTGVSSSHDLYAWKVDGGQAIPFQNNLGSSAFSVSFSPDGKLLAEGSPEGVHLWDVASGKSQALLDSATIGSGSEYPFSPDGKLLATSGPDFTRSTGNPRIGLWDVASGKQVAVISLEDAVAALPIYSSVSSLAFSPDGKILASATGTSVSGNKKDTPVYLWDSHLWDRSTQATQTPTLHAIKTLTGPHSYGVNLSFSPDGRLLAGVSAYDHLIWLWDLTSDSSDPIQTFHAKCNGGSIAFSHDSSLLISAGASLCSLELWNVKSGQEITGFPPLYGVTQVTFNPDGTRLALGMGDLTIQLWGIL